jgi:hypothetical protein
MELPDSTGARKPERHAGGQLKKGFTANPAGRPKGSRNKLGEAFVNDLYNDYLQHGPEVIAAVRETR